VTQDPAGPTSIIKAISRRGAQSPPYLDSVDARNSPPGLLDDHFRSLCVPSYPASALHKTTPAWGENQKRNGFPPGAQNRPQTRPGRGTKPAAPNPPAWVACPVSAKSEKLATPHRNERGTPD